jgi:SAM-dependent methyltransferase
MSSAQRVVWDGLRGALASDGIFAEESPGVFRNTAPSELLCGDGWRDFAHLFGSVWMTTVADLDETGAPAFPRRHGTDFWAWLAVHPDERARFDHAMEQGWERRLERLDSVGWRGDETIVDIGCGNGSLLLALLERHRNLPGVVFDLAETVRDESSFGERCAFVAGDFFDRVPPGDAYVLSTILHDWDDASAERILRTIRATASHGARLVLLEAVIEDGNEPDGAKWLDLLLLALLGGRERDGRQWRALLDGAWFDVERIGGGMIEARCR